MTTKPLDVGGAGAGPNGPPDPVQVQDVAGSADEPSCGGAMSAKVGMVSLGCAKNLVDAEIMLGSLIKAGMEITNDPESADALIVNTCSFIDAAQEESVDTILEMASERDAYRGHQALIVSGCLPQRFREELPKLLPEVDAFMGIDQVESIPDIVRQALESRRSRSEGSLPEALRSPDGGGKSGGRRSSKEAAALATVSEDAGRRDGPEAPEPLVSVDLRPDYIPDYQTPRFRLTPPHFAYIKIAEGCNHPCSFCIIPRMRGSHRSRLQSDIIEEARELVGAGVRELNLISQDSTYYGLDLRSGHRRNIASPARFQEATRNLPTDSTTICTLLRALDAIPGDFWVRLLYTHPAHWTDELIETIADCPKVARYIDMPLQHIHESMLERMRRETSRQHIEDLIGRIRAGVPDIAIRTTFIVGFPGETPAYFESLLEFIRRTRFERLGVFTYSHEEGTRSASMAKQVTERTKRKRRDRAMAGQLTIARELGQATIGKTLTVLGERAMDADRVESEDRPAVQSWEHGLIRESGEGGIQGLIDSGCVVARSQADAPDIDGRVYVRGTIPIGEFSPVRIIASADYDLIAEPV